jgi:energy-coupling factor transporter ATP-binding protein EcfA2
MPGRPHFPGAVIVIRSVEIKGLRGIREGILTDLSPLVVLVGPNGSGKSTVIEAILIAAGPVTAEAIVEVVRRHEAGGSGPRWLLWKAGAVGPTEVKVMSEKVSRRCSLELDRGKPENETVITFRVYHNNSHVGDGWVRGVKNKYENCSSFGYYPVEDVPEVHLVEAYPTDFQRPLHELYTRAVQNGRRKEATGIIVDVFPGVSNVEILTEQGEPILHLVFADYSVPATLAGDGIQSLLRLSLELAASGGGVALLEEPEVHQHPGAIRQSARAIMAAVRRHIQVVLTTHSLELIDALLAESSDQDLTRLSLYRLQLQGGVLKSSRLPGPDIAFSRAEIEDDLR